MTSACGGGDDAAGQVATTAGGKEKKDTEGAGGGGGAPPEEPERMPDWNLVDVNPSSVTFEETVSPRDSLGQVSAWYFGHADCAICTTQFGYLNLLQGELDAEKPPVKIVIRGINQRTFEEYNDTFTKGRFLAWLQDTKEEHAWLSWDAKWRDFVVLNEENQEIARYNLTEFDLKIPKHYAELKDLLLEASEKAAKAAAAQ